MSWELNSMSNIINTITTEFHLILVIMIIIMLVIVGMGIYLLKSPRKLKWNCSSTTFLVISVLLLGLTLTQIGEAIVKESPGEKESRNKTERQEKDKDKNTEKTDVIPKSDETKKADTQKNET